MLSKIVGSVDFNSAAVLIIAFICIAVIITSLIIKRRSRKNIDNDFEIEKIKQANAHEEQLARIGADREYKLGQLQQNLITSHKSVTS